MSVSPIVLGPNKLWVAVLLAIFALTGAVALNAEPMAGLKAGGITPASNLQTDAQTAQQQNKPLVIYVAAAYCTYCLRLERDVLNTVAASSAYQHIVLRRLLRDDTRPIIDFDGQGRSPASWVTRHDVPLSPTLLFVNARGEEIAPRLVGYQGPEFYWYYLDERIALASQNLTQR